MLRVPPLHLCSSWTDSYFMSKLLQLTFDVMILHKNYHECVSDVIFTFTNAERFSLLSELYSYVLIIHVPLCFHSMKSKYKIIEWGAVCTPSIVYLGTKEIYDELLNAFSYERFVFK